MFMFVFILYLIVISYFIATILLKNVLSKVAGWEKRYKSRGREMTIEAGLKPSEHYDFLFLTTLLITETVKFS